MLHRVEATFASNVYWKQKKEQRHQTLESNRFFEEKFVVTKGTKYENLENLLYRKL